MAEHMKRFLTARWVQLGMLNYEIDPVILADHVPAGTELDSFGGQTFASIVGFMFLDTKVLGIPVPFHRNFEEVNLRFYVRREAEGEVRRGVVFVKEIVPKRAIAWLARWLYNENYVRHPMRHVDKPIDDGGHDVTYEWTRRGATEHVAVRTGGTAFLPADGSKEAFIAEHYWGYATQRNGETTEYRVDHPPWHVWSAAESSFAADVESLYGAKFVEPLAGPPASAFLAEGSPIVVGRGRRLSL